MSQWDTLRSYIALCLVSMLLLGVVLALGEGSGDGLDPWGVRGVGLAFIASCAVGASLALRPNWHLRRGPRGPEGPGGPRTETPPDAHEPPSRRGHHPGCEPFDGHRVREGGRWWCAGCLGLLAGACVGGGLMAAYMLVRPDLDADAWRGLGYVGAALVGLGIAATSHVSRRATLHVLLNITLVVGMAMVVVGAMELTRMWPVGLFTVLLSVLWLETRIAVSQHVHAIVCARCPEGCKAYR